MNNQEEFLREVFTRHVQKNLFEEVLFGDENEIKLIQQRYRELDDSMERAIVDIALNSDIFVNTPFTESYKTRDTLSWDALSKYKEDRESSYATWGPAILAEMITQDLFMTTRMDHRDNPEGAYETAVNLFVAGNLGRLGSLNPCQMTGKRMLFTLDGWKPRLKEFLNSKIQDVSDLIEPPGLQHAIVNFKSGKLIVGDSIRLESLIKVMRSLEEGDLESIQGVINRTHQYLKSNLISVFVSNSSPQVYHDGNSLLLVGHEEENEGGRKVTDFKSVASICTDLWWTTIMDRVDLEEVLIKEGKTQDQATEIVNSLIENSENSQVEIAPGTYHLYFHGNPDFIHQDYQIEGAPDMGDLQPYFLLSTKELDITPKSRATKSIKP